MGRIWRLILVLAFLGCTVLPAPAVDARVLYRDMEGPDVKEVQQILQNLGYGIDVDGRFGRETEDAVASFQRDQGISVDGIVGPVTIEALTQAEQRIHVVRAGDCLSQLARLYGTTVDAIMKANKLTNYVIYVDQKLLIPASRLALGGGWETDSERTLDREKVSYTGFESMLRSLLWPVRGIVTSQYGWRIHPIYGYRQFHGGIDIMAPEGTLVRAAASGTILRCENMGGYGLGIVIDHGYGVTTWYGHNSWLLTKTGEKVVRGQPIARVGCTGTSTGPHLDFRIKIDGKYVDPLEWLP